MFAIIKRFQYLKNTKSSIKKKGKIFRTFKKLKQAIENFVITKIKKTVIEIITVLITRGKKNQGFYIALLTTY